MNIFVKIVKTSFPRLWKQILMNTLENRTENGLTLSPLGAKLGIDSGALSKIETGKKEFDQKSLNNLAAVFELDFAK